MIEAYITPMAPDMKQVVSIIDLRVANDARHEAGSVIHRLAYGI